MHAYTCTHHLLSTCVWCFSTVPEHLNHILTAFYFYDFLFLLPELLQLGRTRASLATLHRMKPSYSVHNFVRAVVSSKAKFSRQRGFSFVLRL